MQGAKYTGRRKFIAVDQQPALAKRIVTTMADDKKQLGAPFIKSWVQGMIDDAARKRREINKRRLK